MTPTTIILFTPLPLPLLLHELNPHLTPSLGGKRTLPFKSQIRAPAKASVWVASMNGSPSSMICLHRRSQGIQRYKPCVSYRSWIYPREESGDDREDGNGRRKKSKQTTVKSRFPSFLLASTSPYQLHTTYKHTCSHYNAPASSHHLHPLLSSVNGSIFHLPISSHNHPASSHPPLSLSHQLQRPPNKNKLLPIPLPQSTDRQSWEAKEVIRKIHQSFSKSRQR